ncbi:plasmid replication protein RepC [Paracoccus sp. NSM]|uniref:plasmid replication protein RepC n=1 Tax=Paracoccus sp. NSM TaxID=3457784 RepID=UPI004035B264
MSILGHGVVPAGQVSAETAPDGPSASASIDKWDLLRDAVQARRHLGVSDRDLAVLSALLSFHPLPGLDLRAQLTVFPSNASLSARLHGMPESTLRRHLAALVKAGLLTRRDSPNGKRYARRGRDGQIVRAFGFDLMPLARRAAEITAAAQQSRAEAEEMRRLREEISVNLRDASRALIAAMSEGAAPALSSERLADLHRQSRRKSDLAELHRLCAESRAALDLVAPIAVETTIPGGDDNQNERHYQSSETDNLESECHEDGETRECGAKGLTIETVLLATPDIRAYSAKPIRNWRDLLDVGAFVAPMLGITHPVWAAARKAMGDDVAATSIACLLQQASRIRSPGAYLRVLTAHAAKGAFDPARMVNALLSLDARPAAG